MSPGPNEKPDGSATQACGAGMRDGRWRRIRTFARAALELFFPIPVVAGCGWAVLHAARPPEAALAGLRSETVVGLVALPFVLCFILAMRMGICLGRGGLIIHIHRSAPRVASETIRRTWAYERDRYRRSVSRARFYAVQFGATATLVLALATLLLARYGSRVSSGTSSGNDLGVFAAIGAASVAAATATTFLVNFMKVLVRISVHDISAAAFSWPTRALSLVVIGNVGLLLVLPITTLQTAVLLGMFAGVTGEHTISLLLERTGKSFGFAPAVQRRPSPLLAIEGLLPEHVQRLEEEGVFSIHDLALAPTARLFFNTPYGLPKISDWQDQALLLTRWGPERTRDLFDKVGIRGAIALRRIAHELPDQARDPLRRALRLENEAALEPLLSVIERDETTLRLELHAEQCVVLEPAHFDDPIVEGEEIQNCEAPEAPAAAAA